MYLLATNAMVALFPGLLWLWVMTRRGRHVPEPRYLLLWVFLVGVLGGPVVLLVRPILEGMVPPLPPLEMLLVDAFAITAITEEVVKVLAFVVGVLWCRHLDEPIDGIVYGAAAGLGFATFENAWYLRMTGDVELIVMRAFTSTLAHACMTGSLAFTVAMLKLRWGRFGSLIFPTVGLVGMVLFHGIYDFVLIALPQYAPLALVVVLPVLMVTVALQVSWARGRSAQYRRRSAARVLGAFCATRPTDCGDRSLETAVTGR